MPLAATLFAIQAQQNAAAPQGQASSASANSDAGVRTFATYCSGCHGEDGRGGERAPNIASTRNIVAMSDEDLESVVRKGVSGSGMPSFSFLGDPEIHNVVAHLRNLQGKNSVKQTKGDPQAGHALFFGKAECSTCHMVKGEGGYIASDLSDYAAGIAPDAVEAAITKPDEVLAATSTVVELVLPNGEHLSGVARAEDNFTVTIQTKDGRWRTFDKQKLAKIDHTDRSLHPRDYGTRLSATELDDLVSYLTATAVNAPPKHGQRRNH
jgi:cytochrome c oxidase cbb3-type subunit III